MEPYVLKLEIPLKDLHKSYVARPWANLRLLSCDGNSHANTWIGKFKFGIDYCFCQQRVDDRAVDPVGRRRQLKFCCRIVCVPQMGTYYSLDKWEYPVKMEISIPDLHEVKAHMWSFSPENRRSFAIMINMEEPQHPLLQQNDHITLTAEIRPEQILHGISLHIPNTEDQFFVIKYDKRGAVPRLVHKGYKFTRNDNTPKGRTKNNRNLLCKGKCEMRLKLKEELPPVEELKPDLRIPLEFVRVRNDVEHTCEAQYEWEYEFIQHKIKQILKINNNFEQVFKSVLELLKLQRHVHEGTIEKLEKNRRYLGKYLPKQLAEEADVDSSSNTPSTSSESSTLPSVESGENNENDAVTIIENTSNHSNQSTNACANSNSNFGKRKHKAKAAAAFGGGGACDQRMFYGNQLPSKNSFNDTVFQQQQQWIPSQCSLLTTFPTNAPFAGSQSQFCANHPWAPAIARSLCVHGHPICSVCIQQIGKFGKNCSNICPVDYTVMPMIEQQSAAIDQYYQYQQQQHLVAAPALTHDGTFHSPTQWQHGNTSSSYGVVQATATTQHMEAPMHGHWNSLTRQDHQMNGSSTSSSVPPVSWPQSGPTMNNSVGSGVVPNFYGQTPAVSSNGGASATNAPSFHTSPPALQQMNGTTIAADDGGRNTFGFGTGEHEGHWDGTAAFGGDAILHSQQNQPLLVQQQQQQSSNAIASALANQLLPNMAEHGNLVPAVIETNSIEHNQNQNVATCSAQQQQVCDNDNSDYENLDSIELDLEQFLEQQQNLH